MPRTPLITERVSKRDNFEIVGLEIAAILCVEFENQMRLARAAGADASDWNLRVYHEHSAPWSDFQPDDDREDERGDCKTPIVNVWWNDSSFDPKRSNVVESQTSSTTFYIDCYGHGIAEETALGHKPGDALASMESKRAVRAVRNVLMSAHYVSLGLASGFVGRRWVTSITAFQPQIDGRAAQHIVAARVAFQVEFREFSPQHQGVPLDLISAIVTRAGDGRILLSAEFSTD